MGHFSVSKGVYSSSQDSKAQLGEHQIGSKPEDVLKLFNLGLESFVKQLPVYFRIDYGPPN